MTERTCEYCFTVREPGSTLCSNCSAGTTIPAPERGDPDPFKAALDTMAREPRCFPYNGLIVWSFCKEPWHYDRWTWQFYAGEELLESITLERDVVKKFVPENQSVMSLIWDLFLVAHGGLEVLRLVALNGQVKDAVFEVRRVESDREEYISGLTYGQLTEAFRKSKEA